MSETNYEEVIGKNIKSERIKKGWSQSRLSNECGIANTVISAYENGKKTPGLDSVARIATGLGVSIDRLCYGDESESFINSVPDEGRKIVNCIYTLWSMGIISYYENWGQNGYSATPVSEIRGAYLCVREYYIQISRLINRLNDFNQNKNTFPDPDVYLENILSSVAKEINDIISKKRKDIEGKKARPTEGAIRG